MKNFVAIENHSKEELEELLEMASLLKNNKFDDILKNKTMVSVFFNPSTRTRISFDLAMHQLGGHNISIDPGKSSWGIEINEGAIMDGEAEEHLKDISKVLCRYADVIGIRCFPKFKNWDEEKKDIILKNLVKWSSKPVINMETISHPCQAMAMMMAIKDKFSKLKKKKFVLTWVYHPKPLNTAVANSAGLAASLFGMDIEVVNPPGYNLDNSYLSMMANNCKSNGAEFKISNNMGKAFESADFIYAKSWGSLEQYGNFNPKIHDQYKDWIVDKEKMSCTNNAYFSHCLPLRRNVKATDEVIDSANCLIYDEAENRLHVQKAILAKLLGM